MEMSFAGTFSYDSNRYYHIENNYSFVTKEINDIVEV